MAAVTVVVTFVLAIFAKVFADEVNAWLPSLSKRLLSQAVRRLPDDSKARYEEEWESDLSDIPGALSKAMFALGLLLAAGRIRAERSSAGGSVVEKSAGVLEGTSRFALGLLPEPESRAAAFIVSAAINGTICAAVLAGSVLAKDLLIRHQSTGSSIVTSQAAPVASHPVFK